MSIDIMENEEMRMVSFPKKVWNVVRVFLYMLRKGICKKKLLLDLNLLLKRGKIAGKAALVNLALFHHSAAAQPGEYEFSCSNTPAHPNFLFSHVIQAAAAAARKSTSKKASKYHQYVIEEETAAINAAIQMMVGSGGSGALNDVVYYDYNDVASSPVLPGLGFGRSPMVRQLRVTDSPYPVSASEGGDCHVDEAADEFIKRFYSQLRTQSITDS